MISVLGKPQQQSTTINYNQQQQSTTTTTTTTNHHQPPPRTSLPIFVQIPFRKRFKITKNVFKQLKDFVLRGPTDCFGFVFFHTKSSGRF